MSTELTSLTCLSFVCMCVKLKAFNIHITCAIVTLRNYGFYLITLSLILSFSTLRKVWFGKWIFLLLQVSKFEYTYTHYGSTNEYKLLHHFKMPQLLLICFWIRSSICAALIYDWKYAIYRFIIFSYLQWSAQYWV